MGEEAERPALPRPGEAQAQGILVGASESWKSAFRDDGPFWVEGKNMRKESHHSLLFWRSGVVTRRKKYHAKGSAVVTRSVVLLMALCFKREAVRTRSP